MSEQQPLPAVISSKSELLRVQRELKAISDVMQQEQIRTEGSPALPKVSSLLQSISEEVGKNLQEAKDREALQALLQQVQQSAPVIHISFASNPSSKFLAKLTSWFRQEVHPLVLLEVGLQPSIAAGCTIRTTNKYFDLSLRKHLVGKENILFERFQEVANG